MNYLTRQLLNAEEINFIERELEQENQGWEDGKKTAGSHASILKNNSDNKKAGEKKSSSGKNSKNENIEDADFEVVD